MREIKAGQRVAADGRADGIAGDAENRTARQPSTPPPAPPTKLRRPSQQATRRELERKGKWISRAGGTSGAAASGARSARGARAKRLQRQPRPPPRRRRRKRRRLRTFPTRQMLQRRRRRRRVLPRLVRVGVSGGGRVARMQDRRGAAEWGRTRRLPTPPRHCTGQRKQGRRKKALDLVRRHVDRDLATRSAGHVASTAGRKSRATAVPPSPPPPPPPAAAEAGGGEEVDGELTGSGVKAADEAPPRPRRWRPALDAHLSATSDGAR